MLLIMAEKKNTENIDKAKKWLTDDAYRASSEHPKVYSPEKGEIVDSAEFVKTRDAYYKNHNKQMGIGNANGALYYWGHDITKEVAKDDYKDKADKVRRAEKNVKEYGGKRMDEAVNYFLSGGRKKEENNEN